MLKVSKNPKKVECLECGKCLKKLGGGHLEKKHGMNQKDYLRKYPGAKTSSDSFVTLQKEIKKRQYEDIGLNLRKKAGSRTFDFISNRDLKKLLQRDYGVAKQCLKYEFWKPCIILYGAIIEAVLVEMTSAKTFEKAVNKALNEKIITKNNYHKIHVIRDLRNYVHLRKELKEKIKINDHWAQTFADICESIIKHF